MGGTIFIYWTNRPGEQPTNQPIKNHPLGRVSKEQKREKHETIGLE